MVVAAPLAHARAQVLLHLTRMKNNSACESQFPQQQQQQQQRQQQQQFQFKSDVRLYNAATLAGVVLHASVAGAKHHPLLPTARKGMQPTPPRGYVSFRLCLSLSWRGPGELWPFPSWPQQSARWVSLRHTAFQGNGPGCRPEFFCAV